MEIIMVDRAALLLYGFVVAVAFLVTREIFNRLTRGWLEGVVRLRGLSATAEQLQEEIWLSAVQFAQCAFVTYLFWFSPDFDGCNLTSQDMCFTKFWKYEPSDVVVYYYLAEFGWYMSLVLKGAIRVGKSDSKTMELHHYITLLLVSGSFCTHFLKIGLLTFFVFNLSNPLLHLSKLVNYMELRVTRTFTFAAFAVTFAFTRVYLLPAVVIKTTLLHCHTQVSKKVFTQMGPFYTFSNIILISLWLLNIYWMRPIVRVLYQNVAGIAGKVCSDDFVSPDDDEGRKNRPAAKGKEKKEKKEKKKRK